MNQQQPNIDLTKTTAIETQNGGKIWQQGIILRRISKFIIGADEDGIIPIPIFFDPETGEIFQNTLPKELRDEFGGEDDTI
jgi:hypothetical protein